MCRGTKGKRLDAVAAYWLEHFERPELDGEAIEEDVVRAMENLLATEVEPLPGVVETLALCRRLNERWNIATSSNLRLARAAPIQTAFLREALIASRLVIRWLSQSCTGRSSSKQPRDLEVSPTECLVIEDSTHGLRCWEARGSRPSWWYQRSGCRLRASLGRRIISECGWNQTLLNRLVERMPRDGHTGHGNPSTGNG